MGSVQCWGSKGGFDVTVLLIIVNVMRVCYINSDSFVG